MKLSRRDVQRLTGSAPPRRPSKYRAERTEYRGCLYASKSEAARAAVLDADVMTGRILWWLGQPGAFRLGCPENIYKPDFLVIAKDGIHVEDVKGFSTPKFRRDRKLWAAYGPCPLWIVSREGVEVVAPKHLEDRP